MKDDIKALLNVSLKLTRDLLLVPFLISSTSNLRFTTRLFRVIYAYIQRHVIGVLYKDYIVFFKTSTLKFTTIP